MSQIRWAQSLVSNHAPNCRDDSRPAATFVSKLLAFRVPCLKVVQQEKTGSYDDVSREQYWSIRDDHNAGC